MAVIRPKNLPIVTTPNVGDILILDDGGTVRSILYSDLLKKATIAGTASQIAYYATSGNIVSGSSTVTVGAPPMGGTLNGLNVFSQGGGFNANNGTSIAQGTSGGGSITFWYQGGTVGSPTTPVNTSELGFVQALGWNGSAFGPSGAPTALIFAGTETWTPSALGSGIVLQATSNGNLTANIELDIAHGITVPLPSATTIETGLGIGTINAKAGLFDNANRAVSASSPTIQITSASAFSVGQNGATNPAFQVNTSVASSVTGLLINSQPAAGGVSIQVISSTTNEPLAINAKGTGGINLQNVATGPISLGTALIYGGVTLSNSVTGTASMVLSNSPVLVTPNLGTPSTLVATNATGTAAGLTAGNATTAAAAPAGALTGATLAAGVTASSLTSLGTIAALVATQATTPLLIGGSGAASTLTLESTSGAGTTDAIIFKTASQVERGRITTGGFWGIGGGGTAKTFLDINANSASSPALVVSTSLVRMQAADAAAGGMEWVSYGNSSGNVLSGASAGGTSASPSATLSNTSLFNLRGYGHNGTSLQNGAIIIMRSDSLWSGTNQATALDFYTTPTNSTTIARGMSLLPSGSFSVGSSTDFGFGNISATGGFASAVSTTKTSNYSMTVADSSLIFNGAGSLTLTLLAAATYPGRWLTIKTIAAQTVVSATSNVVPMVGGAAGTAILAGTAGKWVNLQSDGVNWIIMAGN